MRTLIAVRTLLVYVLALAAIGSGIVFGFPELLGLAARRSDDGTRPRGPVPPVLSATVVRAPFAESIEALGTVRANESVEITPNRADHVVALHFDDGQGVTAGDLLVELNAAEEHAQLEEAKALCDERQLAHDRVRELYERRISSQQDLDNSAAELAAAKARVTRILAAIADHEVKAPFAGTLGLRRVSVGALVQPSTIITTLDDLSVVKVDFTIPEAWVPAVQPGQRVEAITDVWPGSVFAGEVAGIATRLDESTRSATVRTLLPNDDRRLRPGMLLRVRVDRGDVPVLQVPEGAIVPVGATHHVFRIDAGSIARKVDVRIGRRRVGSVEILQGLDEGDRVVVEGIVRVRPDAPVEVVEAR